MNRTALDYVTKHLSSTNVFLTASAHLVWAARQAKLSGLVLEFGVYSGATANLLGAMFSDRMVYGFDSFQGLPEAWRPGFPAGMFATRGMLPQVASNIELVIGLFGDSLPGFLEKQVANDPGLSISMIHIDCDLYSSTKQSLELCRPFLKEGTVVVFDEYLGYDGWEQHEYRAFQEFIADAKLSYRYLGYNAAHEQVSVMIQ